MGTGGVGKTTLSLALAIHGARQGLKVAAITIDPSRRLAKTLGLKNNSYQSLSWEGFTNPMDVYFLDAEQAFAEFVKSNLSENIYRTISQNRIFKQISKNLRETHNFAAIYKLDQILSEKDYDLVVLDTPPSHQAIDFFESPQNLQKFFSQKIDQKGSGLFNWVQNKGLAFVESILLKLTGGDFVKETEKFFRQVGQLRNDISRVSENFLTQMRSPNSQLILVSSPALDKMSEAAYLQEVITKQGYSLKWCVMNRSFYSELDQGGEITFQSEEEKELYQHFKGQKQRSLEMIQALKKNSGFSQTQFVMLPEISDIMDNVESLMQLSQQVDQNWKLLN